MNYWIFFKSAFRWSKKWFFGSLTTATGTPFAVNSVLDNIGITKLPTHFAVLVSILIIVIAIVIRSIIYMYEELEKLNNEHNEKDEKIRQLEEQIKNKKKEDKKPKQEAHNRALVHDSLYGEASLLLKDAFARIHQLRKLDPITHKNFMDTMITMCEQIRKIFEYKTEKQYSVAIKVSDNETSRQKRYEDYKLTVLYTDKRSKKQRKNLNGCDINLSENSCFEYMVEEGEPNPFYYVNNDVVTDLSYRSSASKIFESSSDIRNLEERKEKWSLPYKSELVVPICPLRIMDMESERKKYVIGFICIDCNDTDGFNEKYDTGIMQGVADGIYDILSLLIESRDNI